jgi:hypothetical protein
VDRDGPILDDSTILAQSPTLLLVLNDLILIVHTCPQRLLELILDRLMIFDIGYGPFSIYLARVSQVDRFFPGILYMDSSEVDLKVLRRVQFIVRHLDLHPRAIKPADQRDHLPDSIGIG